VSGTHVYADNGIYTVTLTVADDDGAVTSDTVLITVDNAPPAVDAGDDATAIEGDVFSLAPATFTDPGSLDSHTATIDWGDGTPVQSGLVTETPSGPPGIPGGQSGTVGGSHIYADDGTYTVTVTVTDDDTASHFDTLYVTVTNVPPTITPSGEPEVIVFSPFEIDSSFSDPGFDCFSCLSAEDFTATIDWGDGAVEPASVTEVPGGPGALSSGSVTGSHIYTWVGTYPVTVTVTDDDGGTASFVHDVEVLGGRELIVQAMRGLEPFSSESRDIQKALDELEDVIDWELWDDEIHLESRHGHRVFSDQKKAVGTLLNALGRSSISPEAAEAAFEAIRLILISDQVIAELAIADAESTPVLSPSRQSSVDRELASAREELVEAQADVDRGRFTHAIDHYRGAWEHALKAQKAAMAPAGISSTTDAGALDDDKGKKK
jgi:PKD repeat protein